MPSSDLSNIKNNIMDKYRKKRYPQYSSWEKGETYTTEVGTAKVIGIDDDGMPIVEMMNGN